MKQTLTFSLSKCTNLEDMTYENLMIIYGVCVVKILK